MGGKGRALKKKKKSGKNKSNPLRLGKKVESNVGTKKKVRIGGAALGVGSPL